MSITQFLGGAKPASNCLWNREFSSVVHSGPLTRTKDPADREVPNTLPLRKALDLFPRKHKNSVEFTIFNTILFRLAKGEHLSLSVFLLLYFSLPLSLCLCLSISLSPTQTHKHRVFETNCFRYHLLFRASADAHS